jgi:hypothetical protein
MEPKMIPGEADRDQRQPWEEPQIILERSLLVSAQEGPTGGPPQPGFIGPLGTSGNSGGCL